MSPPARRASRLSLLGSIAMTVADLALEKEVPFLAKKGLRGGTRLRLCGTPICKRKPSILRWPKPVHFFKKSGARRSISFRPKSARTYATKPTDPIWKGRGLTSMPRLKSFPNQNGVGHCHGTISRPLQSS